MALQAEELVRTPVAAIKSACRARGQLVGVWESAVDYESPSRLAQGFDFYIGQVEGPDQYDRFVKSIPAYRAAFPTLPTAVVTNFGGMNTPELARPFIDAKIACVAECHVKEYPAGTPDAQWDYAHRVLGWDHPQILCGLGAGATMNDYPAFDPHRGDSIFPAERLWE